MNKSVYSLLAAAALVGVAAVPASAAGDEGSASAAVLKANLDVSLLDEGTNVPVSAELNAVRAPESTEENALTAKVKVKGAEGGRPVTMLRAKAATARATVEEGRTEGYSNLVKARVHVPGLPLLSVIKAEAVTSRAVCEAGARPVAKSEIPGTVTVLGKKIKVKADGTTRVEAKGIGTVELRFAETVTTSGTAAATALALDIAVDPGDLGVAKVKGRVTLVEAGCETPAGEGEGNGGSTGGNGGSEGGSTGSTGGNGGSEGGSTGGNGGNGGSEGGSTDGATTGGDSGAAGSSGSTDGKGNEPRPQTGADRSTEQLSGNLAETGGSSATPYIAGGALALVAAGGALVLLRRRRTSGAAGA